MPSFIPCINRRYRISSPRYNYPFSHIPHFPHEKLNPIPRTRNIKRHATVAAHFATAFRPLSPALFLFPAFPLLSQIARKTEHRSSQSKPPFSYSRNKIKNKHASHAYVPAIENDRRLLVRVQFLLAWIMLYLQHSHASLLVPLSLRTLQIPFYVITNHIRVLLSYTKSQNILFIFYFHMKQQPIFPEICLLCHNSLPPHHVIKIIARHCLLWYTSLSSFPVSFSSYRECMAVSSPIPKFHYFSLPYSQNSLISLFPYSQNFRISLFPYSQNFRISLFPFSQNSLILLTSFFIPNL